MENKKLALVFVRLTIEGLLHCSWTSKWPETWVAQFAGAIIYVHEHDKEQNQ